MLRIIVKFIKIYQCRAFLHYLTSDRIFHRERPVFIRGWKVTAELIHMLYTFILEFRTSHKRCFCEIATSFIPKVSPSNPNTLRFLFPSNHNALPSPQHHIKKSEVFMSFLECIGQRNSYLLAICYSDTRINWMPMQMCSTPLTEVSVTHRHTIWFIIPGTKWTLWLYTMSLLTYSCSTDLFLSMACRLVTTK